MEFCLTCKICCRFPERNSPLIPFFLSKERGSYYGCRIDVIKHGEPRTCAQVRGEGYICPYFIPEKNCCSIYDTRPLDCRLYPYMITYDPGYKKVILVLDNKCPYSKEFVKPGEIDITEQDIGLINDPQPDTVFVDELPRLTEFIFGKSGRFRKLKIEDGHIIPYLWKDIMNVLYEEGTGEVYYGVNGNFKRFSRDKEYIYLKKDLVELRGDRYKDKRNLCNYFEKKYSYKIERLSGEKIDECLNLYKKWAERKIKKGITLRGARGADGDYFQKLIEDSFFFHKRALMDFDKLGLEGIRIVVENRLVGYTFGFEEGKDTFYIMAEITDQDYKGINQFIFREFCRIISDDYTYINTMDDSGIEGLKKNKLSYHPIK